MAINFISTDACAIATFGVVHCLWTEMAIKKGKQRDDEKKYCAKLTHQNLMHRLLGIFIK